jgi:hypothetical protein
MATKKKTKIKWSHPSVDKWTAGGFHINRVKTRSRSKGRTHVVKHYVLSWGGLARGFIGSYSTLQQAKDGGEWAKIRYRAIL